MNIGGKTSKKDEGSSADRKKQLLFNNKDIPFNIVENYKTMRTNLMFTLSTTRNKIVVVSDKCRQAHQNSLQCCQRTR